MPWRTFHNGERRARILFFSLALVMLVGVGCIWFSIYSLGKQFKEYSIVTQQRWVVFGQANPHIAVPQIKKEDSTTLVYIPRRDTPAPAPAIEPTATPTPTATATAMPTATVTPKPTAPAKHRSARPRSRHTPTPKPWFHLFKSTE